jgi:hypothetical protein
MFKTRVSENFSKEKDSRTYTINSNVILEPGCLYTYKRCGKHTHTKKN